MDKNKFIFKKFDITHYRQGRLYSAADKNIIAFNIESVKSIDLFLLICVNLQRLNNGGRFRTKSLSLLTGGQRPSKTFNQCSGKQQKRKRPVLGGFQ